MFLHLKVLVCYNCCKTVFNLPPKPFCCNTSWLLQTLVVALFKLLKNECSWHCKVLLWHLYMVCVGFYKFFVFHCFFIISSCCQRPLMSPNGFELWIKRNERYGRFPYVPLGTYIFIFTLINRYYIICRYRLHFLKEYFSYILLYCCSKHIQ